MNPDLESLLTTPWTKERARLVELVDRAAQMTDAARAALAEALARTRPDTASALWLGEHLWSGTFEPMSASAAITDLEWADRRALELPDARVVGIVSLGESTRTCIAALTAIRTELPVIRAPSSIIARGVDDLGVISEVGDPASADRCIVPVAAWSDERIWTSKAGAAAIQAAPASTILLEDPIRHLGMWAVEQWRPAEWLRELSHPGGAPTSQH